MDFASHLLTHVSVRALKYESAVENRMYLCHTCVMCCTSVCRRRNRVCDENKRVSPEDRSLCPTSARLMSPFISVNVRP